MCARQRFLGFKSSMPYIAIYIEYFELNILWIRSVWKRIVGSLLHQYIAAFELQSSSVLPATLEAPWFWMLGVHPFVP